MNTRKVNKGNTEIKLKYDQSKDEVFQSVRKHVHTMLITRLRMTETAKHCTVQQIIQKTRNIANKRAQK